MNRNALKALFASNKNPHRLLELLSLVAGERILPGTTLIIFDEIQECPEATDDILYIYYEQIEKDQPIETLFHNRLLDAYHYYLIIGGMPECVVSWTANKDPKAINRIQRELVQVYENDFSKHNGKVNSGRILMVFRSIVS